MEYRRDNHSQFTAAHFDAHDWLTRWTDAGGGYAAGSGGPHLLRPPCHCAALDSLSSEIDNPDRREALTNHLKGANQHV